LSVRLPLYKLYARLGKYCCARRIHAYSRIASAIDTVARIYMISRDLSVGDVLALDACSACNFAAAGFGLWLWRARGRWLRRGWLGCRPRCFWIVVVASSLAVSGFYCCADGRVYWLVLHVFQYAVDLYYEVRGGMYLPRRGLRAPLWCSMLPCSLRRGLVLPRGLFPSL